MTQVTGGEQYFTAQPTAQHEMHEFDFQLLGQELHFVTDAGVFSKRTIDFGSRTMLEAVGSQQLPAGKILDLGTGYGPVGIAMAKAWQREVDLVDVNQRALSLAEQNAQRNGVSELVDIFQSDIYQQIDQKYAAILVNPPIRAGKTVVTAMLTEAKNHLIKQGKLIAVLQKKQGAPSAQKNMAAAFGNVKVIGKSKGYYVLESINAD
ncbi:class I SAM-dependent methyltransferase [Convivina intestini]|uniref:16S rRNA m(2)G 1207 methyltransferase n=1 Tax=Convivina intestini TaxID=1505726 RepID=A0A2U1D812_9LACO|nr:methyltransferase [Convivina intestini]PVY83749.1 16S rRNA m(2)G 1207 methyltransferase [Convivina intestini]CAH1854956.1 Ribosomal RNA small subunit methyltransferase C [Convivina intestini]SDB92723.1 16S rRNA m(2)G 1207 methyltransferase [Leuconostocaceae bacterium R-53105]